MYQPQDTLYHWLDMPAVYGVHIGSFNLLIEDVDGGRRSDAKATHEFFLELKNITKEFEERGAALEETIRKEFEERGDEIMKEVESELRARGAALQEEGETACAEMIVMACEVRPETEDQLGQYFSLF